MTTAPPHKKHRAPHQKHFSKKTLIGVLSVVLVLGAVLWAADHEKLPEALQHAKAVSYLQQGRDAVLKKLDPAGKTKDKLAGQTPPASGQETGYKHEDRVRLENLISKGALND